MINPERFMLLRALERFSELHPDWRLGQTIANLSYWAKGFDLYRMEYAAWQ